MSRQIIFSDLTGGINNVDTKEKLNSTVKKTETPEMVNVEYLDIGGIKTMDGNQKVGVNDYSIQPHSVIGGWEYIKDEHKYMLIGLSNGEVRLYNAGKDYNDSEENPFELIYKFPTDSERISFCNMNNGVVISNGIDDLVFYEININNNISGEISVENNSDKVYGTDTRFLEELHIGDGIRILNQVYYIESIESDKELTLDTSVDFDEYVYSNTLAESDENSEVTYNGYTKIAQEDSLTLESSVPQYYTNEYCNGMANNSEYLIAGCSSGSIQYTSDVENWTRKASGLSSIDGVCFSESENKFFITGGNEYRILEDPTQSFTSYGELPSGFTSNTVTKPYKFGQNSIAVFGIEGTNHCISIYTNNSWQSATTGTALATIQCVGIASGNDVNVALGESGYICTSSNGYVWSEDNVLLSEELNNVVEGGAYGVEWKSIIYNKDKQLFIAYTNNMLVSTSGDGITWSKPKQTNLYQEDVSIDKTISSCLYNEDMYVCSWISVYKNNEYYEVSFTNNLDQDIDIKKLDLYNPEHDTSYIPDYNIIVGSKDEFVLNISEEDFYTGDNYINDTILSFEYIIDAYSFKAYKSNTSLLNAYLTNSDPEDFEENLKLPVRGLAIQYYAGRLWVGGEYGLFYSAVGQPGNWDKQSDAGVFDTLYNDSSAVKALGIWSEFLMIHKEFSTYLLSCTGDSESIEVKPYSNITCDSQQSWIVSNTKYFVFSKDFLDIYPLVQRTVFSDKFLGIPITEKVRNIFKNLRLQDVSKIFCVSRPKERQMAFYLPTEYCDGSNEVLIYDFQTKSWLFRRVPKETEITIAFNYNNNVYIGTRNGLVLKEFSGPTFTNLSNIKDIDYHYISFNYTTNDKIITKETIDNSNYLVYNYYVDNNITNDKFTISNENINLIGIDWEIKDYDEERSYRAGDNIELIRQYNELEGDRSFPGHEQSYINRFKQIIRVSKQNLIDNGDYYEYTFNLGEVYKNSSSIYKTSGLFITKLFGFYKHVGGYGNFNIGINEYKLFGYDMTISIPKSSLPGMTEILLVCVNTSDVTPNFNNGYISIYTIIQKNVEGEQGLGAYYKSPWFDWVGSYMQSFAEFIVELNLERNNNFYIRTQKDDLYRYEDRRIYNSKINPKSLVFNDESKHWAGIDQDTDIEYKEDRWGNGRFCSLRMLLPNNVFEDFQLEFRAIEPYESFNIYKYGFRRIEAEEAPW